MSFINFNKTYNDSNSISSIDFKLLFICNKSIIIILIMSKLIYFSKNIIPINSVNNNNFFFFIKISSSLKLSNEKSLFLNNF